MFIRTKDGRIIDTNNTSECIYVIRDNSIKKDEFCYVSYLWDNWREYFLIDYQNCMLFSYNSAQIFISDLIKENLEYQNLVIELSPYYKDYKQSDNLEELCDEFTYEYDKNSKHEICWKDTNTGKWYDYDVDILLNEKEKLTIKGAIWTDKGLIYVAKMNEDGELVLL